MTDKQNSDWNNLSEEDIASLDMEELEKAFGNILQEGEAFFLAKGCRCSKSWDYC